MNNETNKKIKIVLDLAEQLSDIGTNRNFERKATAGRVNPTPSFTLKTPIIVKPKKDEEK
jgi:hypothetical protein